MSAPVASNVTVPIGTPSGTSPAATPSTEFFNRIVGLFDSQQSQLTVIYLCIGAGIAILLIIFLKWMHWLSITFKNPLLKVWTIEFRQNIAILWTTSTASIIAESIFMLSSLYSICIFIYLTILVQVKVESGTVQHTEDIFRIEWLYWSEFANSIVSGCYLLFRIWSSKHPASAVLGVNGIEVFSAIPSLWSPFQGYFHWHFEYLRVVRFYGAFQILSNHPKLKLSGRNYLLTSYILSSVCMLFGAAGFFFVIENKWLNQGSQIGNMIDAIYYVVITVTTVGYGDITPKTILGRIAAVALAFTAVIYIPIRVGQLVSIIGYSYSNQVKKSGNHIIVSAATARDFQNFVGEFFHPDRKFQDIQIVLLTHKPEIISDLTDLLNNPDVQLRLQAVYSGLSTHQEHENLHMDSAKALFLLADKSLGANGDASTLVTAMNIAQKFPKLPIYMQLQSRASKATAIARGLTKTLCIQDMRLGMIVQNVIHPGFCPLLMNLMRSSTDPPPVQYTQNRWVDEYQHGAGNELYLHAPLSDFTGLTFPQASLYIYKKYGIVLLGLAHKIEKLVCVEDPLSSSKDFGGRSSSTKNEYTSSTSDNKPSISESSTIMTSASVGSSISAAADTKRLLPQHSKNHGTGRNNSANENVRGNSRQSQHHHHRQSRTSFDGRQSFEIDATHGSGESPSLLKDNLSLELKVEWQLALNPGKDTIIKPNDFGLVIAQDEDAVEDICGDDLSLLQSIIAETDTWSKIPHSQLHLHVQMNLDHNDNLCNGLSELTSLDNLRRLQLLKSRNDIKAPGSKVSSEEKTDPNLETRPAKSIATSTRKHDQSKDTSSNGNKDSLNVASNAVSPSESPEIVNQKSTDPHRSSPTLEDIPPSERKPLRSMTRGVLILEKSEPKITTASGQNLSSTVVGGSLQTLQVNPFGFDAEASALAQDQKGMVQMSETIGLKVPKELLESYELEKTFLKKLDEITVTQAMPLKNHIVIMGDWEEDMYDLTMGLRHKGFSARGGFHPILFFGPNPPPHAMWHRTRIFTEVYYMKGSQCSPSDVIKAHVEDAHHVLILSSSTGRKDYELSDNPSSPQYVISDSRSLTALMLLSKLTTAQITVEFFNPDSLDLLFSASPILYGSTPSPKRQPIEFAQYVEANRAYRELRGRGVTSNPFFAGGNIFISSFLDSLVSLAYFNEEIVMIISAFTSPDALQSVPIRLLIAAYPYLIEPKRRKRGHSSGGVTSSPLYSSPNPTRKRTSAAASAVNFSLDSKGNGPSEIKIDPVFEEEMSDFTASILNNLPIKITFYDIYLHFLKYSNAVMVGVMRMHRGASKPYCVAAPSPHEPVHINDTLFILDSTKLRAAED